MYKVIMVSPGGTKRDFQGDFYSSNAAEDFVRENGYEYCDENGFVWRLEVVEDGPTPAGFIIPDADWAKTFLELEEHGDYQALFYLSDIMENTFVRWQRLKYIAIRKLVEALLELNHIVMLMENDEIQMDSIIEDAYHSLMARLASIAEESSGIV